MPGCVTAPERAACACKSQLASLLACQMPLRLGLPSMRAGRAFCAWPTLCVMDTATTAPTAAAAMATDRIGRKNRALMILSFSTSRLLQRIVFDANEIGGAVFGRRMRTATFRIGKLFGARSPQQPRQPVVSLDAARLVIEPVG